MTRAQLIALAVTIVSFGGAGTVLLINATSGNVVSAPPGTFEVVDRSTCTQQACAAPLCTAANNVIADAGQPCTAQLVTCDMRVGRRAREWLSDAGLAVGPQLYQRIRVVGARCAVDGGFAWGIPLDDNGLPQFVSVAPVTPNCVRAPLDGGTSCLRDLGDGDGGKYFGAGNVFPAAQAAGSNCDQVACSIFFGDDPTTGL